MVRYNVRVSNLSRSLMSIQRDFSKGWTMRQMLEIAGDQMIKSVNKTFEKEGRPKHWKGLAESTKANYRRRGMDPTQHKILQDKGWLKGSITKEVNVLKSQVRWGSGTIAPYGIYHEFGTKYMPRRPFLTHPPMDNVMFQQDIRAIMRRWKMLIPGAFAKARFV